MSMELDHQELDDYFGRSAATSIVSWAGSRWYAKASYQTNWRELLAWRLGRGWLNVAEVVPAGEVSDAHWLSGEKFQQLGAAHLVLVKLGQDYLAKELPLQVLESALAYELVFSMWIRRRDAHAWNRSYVDGIPIFFDHHIAFGAEPENDDLRSFFRRVGPDPGWAGTWRVREVSDRAFTPTTKSERVAGKPLSIHRVRDRGLFDRELDAAASRVREIGDPALGQERGVIPPDLHDAVTALLRRTRDELTEALDVLRSVIYQT